MKPTTWLLIGAILSVVLVIGFLFVRLRVRQFFYPVATGMPENVAQSMDEVLKRLEAALAEHVPSTLDGLQPGLTAAEIAKLEQQAGITLPEDLRAFYMWRNGQGDEFQSDFIPGHHFPSLQSAIQQKAALDAQLDDATLVQRAAHSLFAGHRSGWLPLFDDGSGDGYFYDPERPYGKGAVFYHFTEDGYYRFFPSAKNLLVAITECYEKKIYSVDAKGQFVEDFIKSDTVMSAYSSTH